MSRLRKYKINKNTHYKLKCQDYEKNKIQLKNNKKGHTCTQQIIIKTGTEPFVREYDSYLASLFFYSPSATVNFILIFLSFISFAIQSIHIHDKTIMLLYQSSLGWAPF